MAGLPSLTSGASLAEAVDVLTRLFGDSGIESAQADARILVAHALRLNRAGLISQSDRRLDAPEIDAIAARGLRRLNREPVARIVGTKEFWSLPLEISPAVLVPRPDTETLVELALDWIDQRSLRAERLRVLDIGTGSGAILLALVSELDNAFGTGIDISEEALAVARRNAERLGFANRTTFLLGDFGKDLEGPFDLVVSNPPYVRSADIGTLDPDVREHDPHLALDGGVDGLSAYRAIAGEARRMLAPGGQLIVELGIGQEADVSRLITAAGLGVSGPARKDLGGVSRALSASAP
jgi:release factor glutamine methyltransferase